MEDSHDSITGVAGKEEMLNYICCQNDRKTDTSDFLEENTDVEVENHSTMSVSNGEYYDHTVAILEDGSSTKSTTSHACNSIAENAIDDSCSFHVETGVYFDSSIATQ